MSQHPVGAIVPRALRGALIGGDAPNQIRPTPFRGFTNVRPSA
jgi:hypothetical protein